MRLSVKLGTREQEFVVVDSQLLDILNQNVVETELTGLDAVRAALDAPIGIDDFDALVGPDESVVIVTSDITRPFPTSTVVPLVLERLAANGVRDEQITIVFALGSHRSHTPAEQEALVGKEIFERYRCVDSDQTDVVRLGITTQGTPVDVSRIVAEADRRICLGNIEYHYFAGYSGGAKAIMPGCSSHEAIQANHRFMVQAAAHAGNVDRNPVRDDLEEAISRFCPIDCIVNVVLDERKQVIHAVCGDFVKAHRVGCDVLDRVYLKPIEKRADIVIASQGGAPKDLNLYQTQKALDNAKNAVRDGGIIILVGACQEGLGEPVFERWLGEAASPDEMVTRIGERFELGGHKAAAIGMVLQKARVFLVSEMNPDFVRTIFLEPYEDVQSALTAALRALGEQATVIVMPHGGSTLPIAKAASPTI